MLNQQQSLLVSRLAFCPVKIPKSGKKRISLDGIDLFVRSTKGLVFIYEVSTGAQLLCVEESKKNQALQLIMSRISEVKDMMNELQV